MSGNGTSKISAHAPQTLLNPQRKRRRLPPGSRQSVAPPTAQTREALISLAHEADKSTNDRKTMTQLQGALKAMEGLDADPSLAMARELQDALMDSYLMGPMRNPKVVESDDPLEQVYARAAADATSTFLFGCSAGFHVLRNKSDAQRREVNLGADACLVGLDGGLGVTTPPAPARFVNAVRTSASNKLVTLQAQGPKSEEQVSNLIKAATRHAKQTQCKRVLFVNASTDKVPGFGHAVDKAGGNLSYRELDWIDGEVPQTPEGRERIVSFVQQLSHEILQEHGKTMVVFNCHIGLDRSGVTNALTQLLVDYRHEPANLKAASDVLYKIKRARPHGISTVFRFHLIMQCYKDLRSIEPKHSPSPATAV